MNSFFLLSKDNYNNNNNNNQSVQPRGRFICTQFRFQGLFSGVLAMFIVISGNFKYLFTFLCSQYYVVPHRVFLLFNFCSTTIQFFLRSRLRNSMGSIAYTADRKNYVHREKLSHACQSILCQSFYFLSLLNSIKFFFLLFFSPSNIDRFKIHFNFLHFEYCSLFDCLSNIVGSVLLLICASQKVLYILTTQTNANLNIERNFTICPLYHTQ